MAPQTLGSCLEIIRGKKKFSARNGQWTGHGGYLTTYTGITHHSPRRQPITTLIRHQLTNQIA